MKALFQKLLVGLAIMMFATPGLVLGAANTDMEILAEKIKADKNAYQKERETVNRELGRLIVEFSEAYAKGPIPNETAKRIRNDFYAMEEKELRLKRANADKMDKVLPPWKVTRYMQIESKIRALVKFELARHIPLTY